MTLYLFVILKCQSSTIVLSPGIKYSLHVRSINTVHEAQYCVMRQIKYMIFIFLGFQV